MKRQYVYISTRLTTCLRSQEILQNHYAWNFEMNSRLYTNGTGFRRLMSLWRSGADQSRQYVVEGIQLSVLYLYMELWYATMGTIGRLGGYFITRSIFNETSIYSLFRHGLYSCIFTGWWLFIAWQTGSSLKKGETLHFLAPSQKLETNIWNV